ncbi:hypothetical protein CQA53_11925, partial [Helicobacter didelphidarum]
NLKDNKPNSEKHREFLKSLNTIGLNNIRAMYEGVNDENRQKKTKSNTLQSSNEKQDKQKTRPKLIGRLATTIIMKDGLWIG